MNIVKFGGKEVTKEESMDSLGVRGQRVSVLSRLKINLAPGFIIDNDQLAALMQLGSEEITKILKPYINHIEGVINKSFSDAQHPLLIKVIESTMLNVVASKVNVHNIGLCDTTIGSFSAFVGSSKFAWDEYCNMVVRIARMEHELEKSADRKKKLNRAIRALENADTVQLAQQAIDVAKGVLPAAFFTNQYAQLLYIIRLSHKIFSTNNLASDSCLLVQAVIIGNYGQHSGYGSVHTRDYLTGERLLDGYYYPKSFNDRGAKKPISALKSIYKKHYDELASVARRLEEHFKTLRRIIFTIENNVLWIIDQRSETSTTAQAELRTLLDLRKRNIINDQYIIEHYKIESVSDLLHPTLDTSSITKFHKVTGGISGATGSAYGRVYFNTIALIEEHRRATLNGEDTNLILAMKSTFAEDVKAIEVANGVLTSEGGYASHAPVVARSLGKIAMINPHITFSNTSMKAGNITIKEGDYITLHVPYTGAPTVYYGRGKLVKQNPQKNGLVDLIHIADKNIHGMHIRANADKATDAEVAKVFGAKGIGLCRTEHMFFDAARINAFRTMIIALTVEERQRALKKIEKFQVDDFTKLFRIMRDKPVTIRLLDAPLHEFLPNSRQSMNDFIAYYRQQNPRTSVEDIKSRCNLHNEFNPMLGHRGIRLAFTYPEVYRMQLRAIFKSLYRIQQEKIKTCPEIMIPMVMLPTELKAIRNGKVIEGKTIKSIREIEKEVRSELKEAGNINYAIGTMIELPTASLQADRIANYAEFFCFGTNDLTQTTHGLSRDDFSNFASDYNEYDIMSYNPFQVLSESVKELITIAIQRGRLTRPNMEVGLCGEHGADPRNIPFIVDSQIDYISCSPYGIPIAMMALAKHCLSVPSE